jgi:hypothetical protein
MKTQHIRTILANVRKRIRPQKTVDDAVNFGKKSWIEQVRRSAEGKREDLPGRLASDVISRITGTQGHIAKGDRFPRIAKKQPPAIADGSGSSPEFFIYDYLDEDNQRVRKSVSLKDPGVLLETAKTSSGKSKKGESDPDRDTRES